MKQPRKVWTEKDEQIIANHYSEMRWPRLKILLPGFTRFQIKQKAHRMSLRKKPGRTIEQIMEDNRLWMKEKRRTDPEPSRESDRRRDERDREKRRAATKRSYRKHFFRTRVRNLRGNNRATYREAAALWKRQKGKCALTDEALDRSAHLDHITPKRLGGRDDISNLQWVSPAVNYAKRDLTQEMFIEMCLLVVRKMKGFLVLPKDFVGEEHGRNREW